MPVTLKSLATAVVAVAEPTTQVVVLAQLMRRHHVGALVVVDETEKSKPVGIVTDRDLVLAVMAEGLDTSLFTAGDVMSGNLVTATPEMDALDAVGLMRAKHLRRLVVVDSAGRLIGIVTLEDLLAQMATELSGLVSAVVGARDREVLQRA